MPCWRPAPYINREDVRVKFLLHGPPCRDLILGRLRGPGALNTTELTLERMFRRTQNLTSKALLARSIPFDLASAERSVYGALCGGLPDPDVAASCRSRKN
jgi:hypothetical protein